VESRLAPEGILVRQARHDAGPRSAPSSRMLEGPVSPGSHRYGPMSAGGIHVRSGAPSPNTRAGLSCLRVHSGTMPMLLHVGFEVELSAPAPTPLILALSPHPEELYRLSAGPLLPPWVTTAQCAATTPIS
jgi:hypothetical protein